MQNHRPAVYVTRRIPDGGVALLREHCDVEVWAGDAPLPRDMLLQKATQVAGLLTMLSDRIDAEVFDAAPQLQVVSNYAVGYDNIDIDEASRRGIPIGHTPDVLTESCADHAFALMLASARRLSEAEAYVRDGQWQTWDPLLLLGRDIHGATLGIIGMGRIGQAIAQRAMGFGMRILYTGRHENKDAAQLGAVYVALETLLRESDFVSLNLPLNQATYHLIGQRELAIMKNDAILINTARGAIVDTEALIEALQTGQIGGAALDVTDPEPLPATHALVGMANCLIVPHIASATYATRDAIGVLAAQNLLAGLRGEAMPHCVNASALSQ